MSGHLAGPDMEHSSLFADDALSRTRIFYDRISISVSWQVILEFLFPFGKVHQAL